MHAYYEPTRAAERDPHARSRACALDAGGGRGGAQGRGLRGRADDGLARHRRSRPRQGARAERPARVRAAGDERHRPAACARGCDAPVRREPGSRRERSSSSPRRRGTQTRSRRRSTKRGIPGSPARWPGTTRSSSSLATARRRRDLADELTGYLLQVRVRPLGRRRLLGRARHELHPRLAEGGAVRLRRGRRGARGRRSGVRSRGVDHARQRGRSRGRSRRRPQGRVRRRAVRARNRDQRALRGQVPARLGALAPGHRRRRSPRSLSSSARRQSSTAARARATISSASSSRSRRTTRACA